MSETTTLKLRHKVTTPDSEFVEVKEIEVPGAPDILPRDQWQPADPNASQAEQDEEYGQYQQQMMNSYQQGIAEAINAAEEEWKAENITYECAIIHEHNTAPAV